MFLTTVYVLVVWRIEESAVSGVEAGTWVFPKQDDAYTQLRSMKANGWNGRVDAHQVQLTDGLRVAR